MNVSFTSTGLTFQPIYEGTVLDSISFSDSTSYAPANCIANAKLGVCTAPSNLEFYNGEYASGVITMTFAQRYGSGKSVQSVIFKFAFNISTDNEVSTSQMVKADQYGYGPCPTAGGCNCTDDSCHCCNGQADFYILSDHDGLQNIFVTGMYQEQMWLSCLVNLGVLVAPNYAPACTLLESNTLCFELSNVSVAKNETISGDLLVTMNTVQLNLGTFYNLQ
eukprot:Phypoly_transcript_17880.p1 GENE.Phypoly_transcript_17880~~Phypoly_transcript_17880.p1  ORF type:complete len:258 (+),score=24.38 Phypoly_transcript_17880:113-775(+)